MIGYTQAFGSIGGVMATGAYYLVVTYGDSLPLVRGGHEAWRYTLMSGVIPGDSADRHPAVPAGIADVAREEAAGTLKRPSFAELFQPQFRRTTIVTTMMMACAYAAAFGAIQQMPRIVPGLPEVARAGARRRRSRPSAPCSRSRRSAGWRDVSCSRFSPCAS